MSIGISVWNPTPKEVEDASAFLNRLREQKKNPKLVHLEDKYAPILAYFMSSRGQTQGEDIQVLAARLLQVQAQGGLSELPSEFVRFVKLCALNGTCAPLPQIQHSAACVAVALSMSGTWPELLENLLQMMTRNSEVEGALVTLRALVERAPGRVNNPDLLARKLVGFLKDPNSKNRENSIGCLKQICEVSPGSLVDHSGVFFASMGSLVAGPDESASTRRSAAHSILLLMDLKKVHAEGLLGETMQQMAEAVGDNDEAVAITACDFWIKFCTGTRSKSENPSLHERVTSVLPRLVSLLVSRLDLPRDQIEPDHVYDVSVPDGNDDTEASKGASHALRKKAAAGLDAICSSSGSESLLPIVLPLLQARLMCEDVHSRETGILALGAIAECQQAMNEHLLHIFPYLLKQLVDPAASIRRITCWTLARYSAWLFKIRAPDETQLLHLKELIQGLMMRILDRHKQVQEAACSSLTSILGFVQPANLETYLEFIIRNLMHAFGLYQRKNVIVLCDALGTLADASGPLLDTPAIATMLLPPLCLRLEKLCEGPVVEEGVELSPLGPLLECITSIVQAMGQGAKPYAGKFFRGALDILERDLGPTISVCALDMLSVLCGVMGPEFWEMARQIKSGKSKHVAEIVASCAKSESPQIRQSACVFFGEAAKTCGSLLVNIMETAMPALIQNLDTKPAAVASNASWAIGEIALRCDSAGLRPFVGPLMSRLIPLVNENRSGSQKLAENVAITIGRIGCICPNLVGAKLEGFCKAWCSQMPRLPCKFERENTSRALCLMAKANPVGVDVE